MLKLPFVYCAECKTCSKRKFKNLFDDKSMLDCADSNGFAIKKIVPGLLWKLDWCKIKREKVEQR